MQRTAIGGIAAGAFALGVLAGALIPAAMDRTQLPGAIAAHMSAMGSMPMMGGSMPMMGGSMPMMGGSMPMMGGSMPMAPGASMPAWHQPHHASPGATQ